MLEHYLLYSQYAGKGIRLKTLPNIYECTSKDVESAFIGRKRKAITEPRPKSVHLLQLGSITVQLANISKQLSMYLSIDMHISIYCISPINYIYIERDRQIDSSFFFFQKESVITFRCSVVGAIRGEIVKKQKGLGHCICNAERFRLTLYQSGDEGVLHGAIF